MTTHAQAYTIARHAAAAAGWPELPENQREGNIYAILRCHRKVRDYLDGHDLLLTDRERAAIETAASAVLGQGWRSA